MQSPELGYHGYCLPQAIIGHAVWLDHRFYLSFRDVEDVLAQRSITVSDRGHGETQWGRIRRAPSDPTRPLQEAGRWKRE